MLMGSLRAPLLQVKEAAQIPLKPDAQNQSPDRWSAGLAFFRPFAAYSIRSLAGHRMAAPWGGGGILPLLSGRRGKF